MSQLSDDQMCYDILNHKLLRKTFPLDNTFNEKSPASILLFLKSNAFSCSSIDSLNRHFHGSV